MNKPFLMYSMFMNLTFLIYIIIFMMLLIPSKTKMIHPLSMIMILILLTISITIKMNSSHKSWMNFILFLIIIGGLMIIFLYITSLANNEFFMMNLFSTKLFFIKMTLLMMMIILMYYYSLNFFKWMNINQEMLNYLMNNNNESHEISLSEMYNLHKNSMLFIMIYLYYALICIMNICYKLKMPLRQLHLFE